MAKQSKAWRPEHLNTTSNHINKIDYMSHAQPDPWAIDLVWFDQTSPPRPSFVAILLYKICSLVLVPLHFSYIASEWIAFPFLFHLIQNAFYDSYQFLIAITTYAMRQRTKISQFFPNCIQFIEIVIKKKQKKKVFLVLEYQVNGIIDIFKYHLVEKFLALICP